jgi:hypothetical protein
MGIPPDRSHIVTRRGARQTGRYPSEAARMVAVTGRPESDASGSVGVRSAWEAGANP